MVYSARFRNGVVKGRLLEGRRFCIYGFPRAEMYVYDMGSFWVECQEHNDFLASCLRGEDCWHGKLWNPIPDERARRFLPVVIDNSLRRKSLIASSMQRFRRAQPHDLMEAALDFPDAWPIYRVLTREPRLLELVRTNPGLAVGIAHGWQLSRIVDRDLSGLNWLGALRQREIAERLFFPPELWRFLARLPRSVTWHDLRALRTAVAEPRVLRALLHVRPDKNFTQLLRVCDAIHPELMILLSNAEPQVRYRSAWRLFWLQWRGPYISPIDISGIRTLRQLQERFDGLERWACPVTPIVESAEQD